MKLVFIVLLVWFGVGCATAGKIKNVQIGMNKETVLYVMGEPDSAEVAGNLEALEYNLSESNFDAQHGIKVPYRVILKNDQVIKYGRGKVNDAALNERRGNAAAYDEQMNAQSRCNASLIAAGIAGGGAQPVGCGQ